MNLEDYNTLNFSIKIGADPDTGLSIYQVVNNHTLVVEYQDFILSRVIETIGALDMRLSEIIFDKANPKEGFSDEQESDAVH